MDDEKINESQNDNSGTHSVQRQVSCDFITDYLDGYELRGDEGDYTPTENERLLIEDALRGFIDENEFKIGIPSPLYCTPMGEYKCQIPMPIKGRRQDVDYCIADIVAALNAANITTEASCCGHGNDSISSIILTDGREINIKNVKYMKRVSNY